MKALLSLVWLTCIGIMVGLSLVPHLISTPNNSDKMLHVVAYCILMLCPVVMFRAMRHRLAMAVGLFAMGAGIEVLQYIIGGRVSSVEDVLANGAGIAAGFVIGLLIRSGLDAVPS